MHPVNVSALKNKPTQALLWAQPQPVVVMSRDSPQSVLMHIGSAGGMDAPFVQRSMAAALFKDGDLSLVRGAKFAQCSLVEFIRYVASNGIPVVNLTEADALEDIQTLNAWLATHAC